MAKNIMFQGTGSNVGKSIVAAAICRILYQEGYKVAPFKSQNMALNSFVTKEGGEMGRAQVVQAEAAGIEPKVEMNPILLKPTGNSSSQVVVMGRPIGNFDAKTYHRDWTLKALGIIENAYEYLNTNYEVIVIEGAGSPAEINLKETEIVNMRVAKMTKAPVILVADIDRGGVLASIIGTLELLDPDERELVKGIIINKFRGDVSLFQSAIDFLEERTGIPVLGVLPYFKGFKIPEEDSVCLDEQTTLEKAKDQIEAVVVRLPRISNFTDFDALDDEPDVKLRYVDSAEDLGNPDLIIIPGSKNTIKDAVYLQKSGLARAIVKNHQKNIPVIGVCGGYQILGKEISDPTATESDIASVKGLGLLDMVTTFEAEKITSQVEAKIIGEGILKDLQGEIVTGYEIHMGRSVLGDKAKPAFCIAQRATDETDVLDGAISNDGLVLGTYLHGIFDNDFLRRHLINQIRVNKGWSPLTNLRVLSTREQRERDLDKLAQLVKENLNMDVLFDIIGAINKESQVVG